MRVYFKSNGILEKPDQRIPSPQSSPRTRGEAKKRIGGVLREPSKFAKIAQLSGTDFQNKIVQSLIDRSRSAFAITVTELKLIAAPAIIGLRRTPKNG